jgi:hypothetical protein
MINRYKQPLATCRLSDRRSEIGVAREPFFVGTVMIEAAFVQYDAGRMKIAQQLRSCGWSAGVGRRPMG